MDHTDKTILFIGATGSIGRPAVSYAVTQGYNTRALVRNIDKARKTLPSQTELFLGDITRPETFAQALHGVDAIVLTVNADGGGKAAAEAIYYTGVRDLLQALGTQKVHIALMTAIGVTVRNSHYNLSSEAHDWKRRAERIVRASRQNYTIVRPGWFDYNDRGEQTIVMLQGDTRRSGSPADGAISRQAIARVLIDSISMPQASRKTFELIAKKGPEQEDLSGIFAGLDPDAKGALDGIRDIDNQPLSDEPVRVREDLAKLSTVSGQS